MAQILDPDVPLPVMKEEKSSKDGVSSPGNDYSNGGTQSGCERSDEPVTGTQPVSSSLNETTDNKVIYRSLKRKVKSLLYEQECFHEELRRLQRKLLRLNRDKTFLLDRLLQYELPEFSSSDDEETASSSADEPDRSYFHSDSGPPVLKKQPKKALPLQGKGNAVKIEQPSKAPPKPKKSIENVERVRCKQTENGKRCAKMVSKRVKSGLCLIHRQTGGAEVERKGPNISSQERRGLSLPHTTTAKQQHIGPSTLSPMISGGFTNDDLQVSDERDIQQDMFVITDNIRSSGPADSPASPDFHSNIYDGDDDLVIDLPE